MENGFQRIGSVNTASISRQLRRLWDHIEAQDKKIEALTAKKTAKKTAKTEVKNNGNSNS